MEIELISPRLKQSQAEINLMETNNGQRIEHNENRLPRAGFSGIRRYHG